MKKYPAKMLRHAAQRLDPQDEPQWYALLPTAGTTAAATNVTSTTYAWKAVGR